MSSVDLDNLSVEDLKKIKKVKKLHWKKEFNEYKQQQEKQKLVHEIMGIEKQRKKIIKAKSTPKSKSKLKTFDDYFQEYIKNKKIPKDTPAYLKKALERAMREYQVWIKHEKSALDNFAEKYVIEGKPKIIPIDYFEEKTPRIKDFLTNHKNIKIRMLMACLMEHQS